jgi:2-oxoisovalerate dehydrogenase E2 component (dihydrolipoyl transacylase)
MAAKIVMPQLGESVTEGTISKWLVKKGDTVKKYEPICEVVTDKVNAEVPSSFSGTMGEIVVEEGQTVSIGTLICYIETSDQPANQENNTKNAVPGHVFVQDKSVEAGKQRFSPAVVRLAQEHNVDLSVVRGTGAAGRITRKDILAFIALAQSKEKIQETELVPVPSEPVAPVKSAVSQVVHHDQGDKIISATSVRKAIAARMLQSKSEIPHAWTMVECDVTNLVQFRQKVKEEFKRREGVSLTYLPFFIKAIVEAIKEYPMINSQWSKDQIIIKKSVNISIAVATEDALYVPVIKDADQRSLLGLAKAIDDLVKKTRAGRLVPDDMSGGTFTVNNTGAFGSIQSVPIINYPQAAILSVEAIVKRPVVIDNMIAIRDMVNLCLSLDHRVLDGLICGRFLQSVKQKMESFGPDMNLY